MKNFLSKLYVSSAFMLLPLISFAQDGRPPQGSVPSPEVFALLGIGALGMYLAAKKKK